MKNTFTVTGMTCSACSSGIERALIKSNGVAHCEVSLMGKSLLIDYDENVISKEEIFAVVQGLGYGIYDEEEIGIKEQSQDKKLFKRFIISVCILIPLLYVSMGAMIGCPLPTFLNMKYQNGHWFALYQVVLSLAIIVVNFAFFRSGIKALFKGVPNMDTLVALGSGVSFLYSLVLTILIFIGRYDGIHFDSWYKNYHMQLHFESSATILTLVTVGKWLEEKSKHKTGNEIEKLLKLTPDTVNIERDGKIITVSVKQVQISDIVVVKQGDYIPVDGVVVSGNSYIDKSAITGESMPIEVKEGDRVTTASLNKGGVIKVRAENIGNDTTLAKIIKMVKEAGASKAPIQKLADKIAGIFVPTVTVISLLTLIIWILIDIKSGLGFYPQHSVTFAISVLVVSCPCALGLATPVAIMTATGKGASLGVLYKDAENLQRLSSVNTVLLDKTATLTEGKLKVTNYFNFVGDQEVNRSIIAGIESNSNHPIAHAIVADVPDYYRVDEYQYYAGKGAVANYDGKTYYLGNEKLIPHITIESDVNEMIDRLQQEGKTIVYFADNSQLCALLAIADTIKTGSKEAVRFLKERSMRVAMLTGDAEKTAKTIAGQIGITDYVAEVMPQDKYNAVIRMQDEGGIVAMVGDGINDSPALKQADVGIAMGAGTDIAIDSAGVVLVNEDIRILDTAFDLSRVTMRNIKQNLFWAFFYNVVMIPVAAGAFYWLHFSFTPTIAAACMSLSSLFVVGNALRLLSYRNKNINKESVLLEDEKSEDNEMKTIVYIEGMCCEHCAKRVVNALSTVNNVVSAEVKLKKNLAVLRSREALSNEEISQVVENAGYKVNNIETK